MPTIRLRTDTPTLRVRSDVPSSRITGLSKQINLDTSGSVSTVGSPLGLLLALTYASALTPAPFTAVVSLDSVFVRIRGEGYTARVRNDSPTGNIRND